MYITSSKQRTKTLSCCQIWSQFTYSIHQNTLKKLRASNIKLTGQIEGYRSVFAEIL
jgi:hypothetical protein